MNQNIAFKDYGNIVFKDCGKKSETELKAKENKDRLKFEKIAKKKYRIVGLMARDEDYDEMHAKIKGYVDAKMEDLESIKKEKTLKENKSSVDKKGMYRWFQSKHKKVNDTVDKTLLICGITLSKTDRKKLSDYFEILFGYCK